MKGLLIKDILNLKGFGKTFLLMIALYFIIALVSGSAAYVTSLLMVFSAMLPMTSMSLDDTAKWSAYAQCMPVSRRQVVLVKYIMVILTAAVAVFFSILASMIVGLRTTLDWQEILVSNGVILSMVMIANAFMLPVMYKFGVEKARLIIIIIFMLCFGVVLLTIGSGEITGPLPRVPFVLAPVFAVVLFAGSYFCSQKIYAMKEF